MLAWCSALALNLSLCVVLLAWKTLSKKNYCTYTRAIFTVSNENLIVKEKLLVCTRLILTRVVADRERQSASTVGIRCIRRKYLVCKASWPLIIKLNGLKLFIVLGTMEIFDFHRLLISSWMAREIDRFSSWAKRIKNFHPANDGNTRFSSSVS